MDNLVANNVDMLRERVKAKFKATFAMLKRKVIDTGLCIQCGKCVALCDVIDWNAALRKPELVGKCTACSLCYYQCPQSLGSPIGDFLSAHVVTATDPIIQDKGQDGGTVTGMLVGLLAAGAIDAAIITVQDPERPWTPKPVIATTSDQIRDASGTIYTHSPVVPALVDAISKGYKRIAIVGTGCKIGAIREMISPGGALSSIEGLSILLIGLFCSESFIPEKLLAFVEGKVDINKITKMRISNGMLWVHANDGSKESFGLTSYAAELDGCTTKACKNCHDFAADNADISVGNIGSNSKHNTVLIRSETGRIAFETCITHGDVAAVDATKEHLSPLVEMAWMKREQNIIRYDVPLAPGRFREHDPASWNVDAYNYTPEVHDELYKQMPHDVHVINDLAGPKVFVASVPEASKDQLTTFNYSTAYDLTFALLKDNPRIKDGKVFIKPNNTGFVGIFKHNPKLGPILAKNGITDDADHQPLATQPATLQGVVDAMLDLGVKKIHIGENMLWDGGTFRAYYETGYPAIFSKNKYKGRVFFIDFCEDDPAPAEYRRLVIKKGKYDISDYYTKFYPPKAFFEEKYDLVFIASLAKVHNCSYYTLVAKNFSVSMNPRRKTGKIEPRWHIHGVPVDVFRKEYLKNLFGQDFKRKFQYLLRETYRHEWDAGLKSKTVKPEKSRVILSGRETTRLAKSLPATFQSTGLMKWFISYGKRVLNVDPHHWAGINLLSLTLGMGYLTTRFTGMYASMVDALKEAGTEVVSLVTGIVGQEGDGPLIYGNAKHGGFAVAGSDPVAIEKVCLDLMFGVDGDFQKAIMDYQKGLMDRFGITNDLLLDEAKRMWTLELLAELTGGEMDNDRMAITVFDYALGQAGRSGLLTGLKPREIYKLRTGTPFAFSEALYCSPDTWLRLIHTDEDVFRNAFWYTTKTIEIPLIPDVVG